MNNSLIFLNSFHLYWWVMNAFVIIYFVNPTQCLRLLYLLGIMSKPKSQTQTWKIDNILVNTFLNQQNLGNKVGGSFTSKAYQNITQKLQEKFETFCKGKGERWKVVDS